MDRDETLKLLRGGKESVAEWKRRRVAGEEIPDLSGADFRGAGQPLLLVSDGLGCELLSRLTASGLIMTPDSWRASLRWA
jgi:hypothetical protein